MGWGEWGGGEEGGRRPSEAGGEGGKGIWAGWRMLREDDLALEGEDRVEGRVAGISDVWTTVGLDGGWLEDEGDGWKRLEWVGLGCGGEGEMDPCWTLGG